jgi:hypothetical protein
MSVTSLGARVRKLQADGDGRSLEQWCAIGRGDIDLLPDHALISICVGQLVPKHLANGVFDSDLCVSWRTCPEGACTPFKDWLAARGTSFDAVLSAAKGALS